MTIHELSELRPITRILVTGGAVTGKKEEE